MYSWNDMIKIMKDWIDENIKNIEDIQSLTQMAERLGYSRFYVTKKFHEIEGVSFREYVSSRKIQKAADDLYMTTERMIDVAVRYGYSSQEAFTRAFVNVFGITPTIYRNLPKPTSSAEKTALLGISGLTEPNKFIIPNGGNSMKLYVKQMYDWNCYAIYAEDVEEKHWEFFKCALFWQIGNNFIKQYDNVKDFEYCAENFSKIGETAFKQQLKIISTPWEKALDLFIPEINKTGVDWFIHGSAAMALWGIDVAPKDINIIVPNYSDFDKVRNHFYKLAIQPIERCDNWVMSGLGGIFMEANIGFAFHNKELEPYDMSQLGKVVHNGNEIYMSSLEMLKQDNLNYNRPERVKLIDGKIKEQK